LEPRFAYWKRNAPPEPQTITVRAKPDGGLRLTALKTPPGDFRTHLVEEEPGRTWRIEITPTTTGVRTSATVLVETVGANGVQKSYPILLRVL
jgi:hypothetical protein